MSEGNSWGHPPKVVHRTLEEETHETMKYYIHQYGVKWSLDALHELRNAIDACIKTKTP